tara:strand:- start:1404 stop:2363 length:960 start_codon:yes stop_codon:yes gene_type:complete
MIKIKSFIKERTNKMLPRILTQICRDPNSNNFGCCDRNYWHYKITDFPSIILQQAIYSLSIFQEKITDKELNNYISKIIIAGGTFWEKRAIRYRSFEEYYPYENGYPPLAFSTLSISKLCYNNKIKTKDVSRGLLKAKKKLYRSFETNAFNQQIIGTTALAYIEKLLPDDGNKLMQVIDKTLDRQSDDGWFMEYDGPDLGYLSVSLDGLWDLYDITKNEKCLKSINNATDFIVNIIDKFKDGLMIYNSRNTNYVLPYGLMRSYFYNNKPLKIYRCLKHLYEPKSNKFHFIDSIDDRYICHYIGHSFVRANNLLETKKLR